MQNGQYHYLSLFQWLPDHRIFVKDGKEIVAKQIISSGASSIG
jgi:hypothetical protein